MHYISMHCGDFSLRSQAAELLVPCAEIRPLIQQAFNVENPSAGLCELLASLELDKNSTVRLVACFQLMRELSLVCRDETFSLSARPMTAGTAELVFSRAASSPTVGEAMRAIAHAYNVFHGDEFNRVEARGRTLSYVMSDDRFPYTRPRDDYLHFSLECALIFLHGAVCELADEDLTFAVRHIATRRPVGSSVSGALAFWNAPVSLGRPYYGITYDASVGARASGGAPRATAFDLAVHNRILALIKARESVGERRGQFSEAVRCALWEGQDDQGAIAERLGVSSATLRRRLADEGACFRDLRHLVMVDRARGLLAQRKTIGEVADELGFSDTRSFTRAFKGWNGMTPSAYAAGSKPGRPSG